jgi:hypothetical protein
MSKQNQRSFFGVRHGVVLGLMVSSVQVLGVGTELVSVELPSDVSVALQKLSYAGEIPGATKDGLYDLVKPQTPGTGSEGSGAHVRVIAGEKLTLMRNYAKKRLSRFANIVAEPSVGWWVKPTLSIGVPSLFGAVGLGVTEVLSRNSDEKLAMRQQAEKVVNCQPHALAQRLVEDKHWGWKASALLAMSTTAYAAGSHEKDFPIVAWWKKRVIRLEVARLLKTQPGIPIVVLVSDDLLEAVLGDLQRIGFELSETSGN